MNAHISVSCHHARILPSCKSKSFFGAVRFFAYCFFYFGYFTKSMGKGRLQKLAVR